MTTLVTRLYESADRASAAARELTGRGFPKNMISVVSGAGDVAAALAKARVPADAAKVYAAAIAKGGAVVAAEAPTGTSFRVRDALDSYGPVASGLASEETFLKTFEPMLTTGKTRERFMTKSGRTTRDMGVHLLTGVRMGGNPWLLMTGTRWSGNNKLLATGTRWCGNNKLLATGTRWCGNTKLLMTGTFWGGWGSRIWTGARMGGNPYLLATGTRWCGNNSLLMTGSYWGGPFARIIR
jgi:hypothetical protein